MSRKIKTRIEVLTYAEIVDRIGAFADYQMQHLSADEQLHLIAVSKAIGDVSRQNKLTPYQIIAMFLSLAVEFMRFSPEYQATVGKSPEDLVEFEKEYSQPSKSVN